jgi:transposase
MLYLGIDQHARQITISLRDGDGDVLQAQQVSTEPKKINAFFQRLARERLRKGESFVAVLEVCGFNDWLIRMLRDYRCHKVILIQPDERKKRKTDRRDAAGLSELLWVNRDRLLLGKPVRGLRQVDIANTTDQENRRLTTLRKEAGQTRRASSTRCGTCSGATTCNGRCPPSGFRPWRQSLGSSKSFCPRLIA